MNWQDEFEACALLTEKGDYANAIANLEKLLQNHGENSLMIYLLAVNYAQLQKPQNAVDLLRHLEQKNDLTPIARELLNDLLAKNPQLNCAPIPAPIPAPPNQSSGLKLNFGAPQQQVAPTPLSSPSGLKLNFATPQQAQNPQPQSSGLRLNFGGAQNQPSPQAPVGLQVNFDAGAARQVGSNMTNDFGPTTLLRCANSQENWREILAFHHDFPETPAKSRDTFYRHNHARFGENWYYADVLTLTYAAAKITRPKNYLDVGTDFGCNLIAAIKASPELNFVACENWEGRSSTPEMVRDKLVPLDMPGKGKFLQGAIENLLPKLFAANQQLNFDLITLDNLTAQNLDAVLRSVLPHLNLNGVLLLANLNIERNLAMILRNVIGSIGGFAVNEFSEVGAGVAVAVKIA